jgi:hypothetical protein
MRNVVSGDDRHHPGQETGTGGLDTPEVGVGMGTPQYAGIEHVG